MAADKGHTETAALLIAKGADADPRRSSAWTPLHRAAQNGHKDVVALLIANGADVNATRSHGWTPLHGAAQSGHKDVVALLIAKGADVNAKNSSGWTPLLLAAEKGHTETAALLIAKGPDVDARTSSGWTPLLLAADKGHTETAALLIAKGADVNVRDASRWTPLLVAADKGHTEVVDLLIATGANVNASHSSGWTPLLLAAEKGHMETAALLSAKGAPTSGQGAERATPLHWAARTGRKALADLLLANGASANAKDDHGLTPLHEAARGGHTEVAQVLMVRGADVRAQATEVVRVQGKRHRHVVRDFLAGLLSDWIVGKVAGFATDQPPAGVGASRRERSVASLPTTAASYLHPSTPPAEDPGELWDDGIQVYADGTEAHWEERTIRGITPLHLAAESGSLEVVELLIARGADADAKDSEGQTALDLGASHGHPEVVEFLRSGTGNATPLPVRERPASGGGAALGPSGPVAAHRETPAAAPPQATRRGNEMPGSAASTRGERPAPSYGSGTDGRTVPAVVSCPRLASRPRPGQLLQDWSGKPAMMLLGEADWHSETSRTGGYGGESDLSAAIRLGWDDQALYVVIRVRDDTVVRPRSMGEVDHSDAIVLSVTDALSGELNQFVVAPLMTGVVVWRAEPEALAGAVKSASTAFRTEPLAGPADHAAYELALPWSELMFVRPVTGGQFLFAVSVCDNDGAETQGLLERSARVVLAGPESRHESPPGAPVT